MNFINACKKVKKGKVITRKAWPVEKGMKHIPNPNTKEWPNSFGEWFDRLAVPTTLTRHVGHDGSWFYRTNLSSEGGHVTCDYSPSLEDILATDWIVLTDKGRNR